LGAGGDQLKILHVTECYDGGVSRAIDTISHLYDGAAHYLLARGSDSRAGGRYDRVFEFERNSHIANIRRTHAIIRDLNPDVIHAHSSWAGMYARAFPTGVPIVYQPHCFVFDDPYRPSYLRTAYFLIEKMLSRRASSVIVLSAHERSLAEKLRSDWRVVELPNVAGLHFDTPLALTGSKGVPTISMVGRLARQKAPDFFAQTARLAEQAGEQWRFVWIGDGDPHYRDTLESAGVEVTGWLNQGDLRQKLTSSSIYFHSAAYEGYPLSVLEAVAIGLPVVVRDLPCFSGSGLATVNSPEAALETMRGALSDVETMNRLISASRQLNSHHTPEAQVDALRKAYDMAMAS
jgi:glycosyltransferase involved in cell wall biosynthesis